MYINEAVTRFLTHIKVVKNSSIHTERNYRIDLTKLITFLEAANRNELSTIDSTILRAFIASLFQASISKKSIARHISALRSFFKYLIKEKIIEKNPALDLVLPKTDKKIPNVLTKEELQILFQKPDTSTLFGLRDKAIMELIFSSGLRLSEIAGLNRTDLDLTALRVTVRGKGRKERILPITPHAKQVLSTYLETESRYADGERWKKELDRNAVFLNRWGRRISPRSIDRAFQDYVRAAGLARRITPHVLRHTIATNLLENGMDIKTIQHLLGHSSSQATTIYTHVSKGLKKKVYDAAHPRALYDTVDTPTEQVVRDLEHAHQEAQSASGGSSEEDSPP